MGQTSAGSQAGGGGVYNSEGGGSGEGLTAGGRVHTYNQFPYTRRNNNQQSESTLIT